MFYRETKIGKIARPRRPLLPTVSSANTTGRNVGLRKEPGGKTQMKLILGPGDITAGVRRRAAIKTPRGGSHKDYERGQTGSAERLGTTTQNVRRYGCGKR